MPIFRVEEVMLNYAEAMCELGEFTQSVADQTINKLRPRANVSPMKVSEINESFDRNVTLAIRLTAAIMPSILCYGKYAVKDVLNYFPKDSGSTI